MFARDPSIEDRGMFAHHFLQESEGYMGLTEPPAPNSNASVSNIYDSHNTGDSYNICRTITHEIARINAQITLANRLLLKNPYRNALGSRAANSFSKNNLPMFKVQVEGNWTSHFDTAGFGRLLHGGGEWGSDAGDHKQQRQLIGQGFARHANSGTQGGGFGAHAPGGTRCSNDGGPKAAQKKILEFEHMVSLELVDMIILHLAGNGDVKAAITGIQQYMVKSGVSITHGKLKLKNFNKSAMEQMWSTVISDIVWSFSVIGIAVGEVSRNSITGIRMQIMKPDSYVIRYNIKNGINEYMITDRVTGEIKTNILMFSKFAPGFGGKITSPMANLLVPYLKLMYLEELHRYSQTRKTYPLLYLQETPFKPVLRERNRGEHPGNIRLHGGRRGDSRQDIVSASSALSAAMNLKVPNGNPRRFMNPLSPEALSSNVLINEEAPLVDVNTLEGRDAIVEHRIGEKSAHGKSKKSVAPHVQPFSVRSSEMGEYVFLHQPNDYKSIPRVENTINITEERERFFRIVIAEFMTPEKLIRDLGKSRFKKDDEAQTKAMLRTVFQWAVGIESRINGVIDPLFANVDPSIYALTDISASSMINELGAGHLGHWGCKQESKHDDHLQFAAKLKQHTSWMSDEYLGISLEDKTSILFDALSKYKGLTTLAQKKNLVVMLDGRFVVRNLERDRRNGATTPRQQGSQATSGNAKVMVGNFMRHSGFGAFEAMQGELSSGKKKDKEAGEEAGEEDAELAEFHIERAKKLKGKLLFAVFGARVFEELFEPLLEPTGPEPTFSNDRGEAATAGAQNAKRLAEPPAEFMQLFPILDFPPNLQSARHQRFGAKEFSKMSVAEALRHDVSDQFEHAPRRLSKKRKQPASTNKNVDGLPNAKEPRKTGVQSISLLRSRSKGSDQREPLLQNKALFAPKSESGINRPLPHTQQQQQQQRRQQQRSRLLSSQEIEHYTVSNAVKHVRDKINKDAHSSSNITNSAQKITNITSLSGAVENRLSYDPKKQTTSSATNARGFPKRVEIQKHPGNRFATTEKSSEQNDQSTSTMQAKQSVTKDPHNDRSKLTGQQAPKPRDKKAKKKEKEGKEEKEEAEKATTKKSAVATTKKSGSGAIVGQQRPPTKKSLQTERKKELRRESPTATPLVPGANQQKEKGTQQKKQRSIEQQQVSSRDATNKEQRAPKQPKRQDSSKRPSAVSSNQQTDPSNKDQASSTSQQKGTRSRNQPPRKTASLQDSGHQDTFSEVAQMMRDHSPRFGFGDSSSSVHSGVGAMTGNKVKMQQMVTSWLNCPLRVLKDIANSIAFVRARRKTMMFNQMHILTLSDQSGETHKKSFNEAFGKRAKAASIESVHSADVIRSEEFAHMQINNLIENTEKDFNTRVRHDQLSESVLALSIGVVTEARVIANISKAELSIQSDRARTDLIRAKMEYHSLIQYPNEPSLHEPSQQ